MLFIWNHYRFPIYIAALVLLALAAWRYGKGPERWTAYTLLGMLAVSETYLAVVGRRSLRTEVDPGMFAIDLIATVILVTVALRANRTYTLWIAGFQIIALMAHFAKELASQISPISYFIMTVGPSYLQIFALAAGLLIHLRRERRLGSYRSWRSSSSRSQATMPRS